MSNILPRHQFYFYPVTFGLWDWQVVEHRHLFPTNLDYRLALVESDPFVSRIPIWQKPDFAGMTLRGQL
jgi:hypothetical protein